MKKAKLTKIFKTLTLVVIGIGLLFSALMIIYLCIKNIVPSDKTSPTAVIETEKTEATPYVTETPEMATEAPTPTPMPTPTPITYKDYTLLSAGDAMLYQSMVDSAKKLGGDTHDFSDLTKYVKEIITNSDLAVVNFEATCLGNGKYTFYPNFNVPDAFGSHLKEIGFDVALFANNHCYDTLHDGFMNTQKVLTNSGLTVYGARQDESGNSYGISMMGDIALGMLDYTYESPCKTDGTKNLNWIKVNDTDVDFVDTFNTEKMDSFYSEVSKRIAELNKQGAELIVFYIHWGDEYNETPNTLQKTIAQKLCDLGVDILIGSHTHCVQPVETFTNADGKRMVCYYSLGNFTSAQNRETFQTNKERGFYTENEILSIVKIRKYSTGEVVVVNADYEPLWQHRHTEDSRLQYTIVPLRYALESEESMSAYGLTKSSFGVNNAKAANDYIKKLMDVGIEKFNSGIVLPYEE